MSHSEKIKTIIEEAVAEVFQVALPNLRAQIVSRTVEELQSLEPAPGSLPTDLLNAAAASIQDSASQAEILRHLLEGTARFCSRAALFVVKGGSANGWQATGFENNDAVKAMNLNASAGLVARAIQGRAPATGNISEFDSEFAASVGVPADGNCVVLPLVVKEKAAAVIYADAGKVPDATVDASALSVLCRIAALWLELTALRKAGATMPAEEAPAHAQAAAHLQEAAVAQVAVPREGDEIHKKAQRFARLLVDEIRLYNQSKVAEGRQHRDLYDRLKDDIEKSRVTYEKRFGESTAGPANYFNQELIRILADNDIALMGGGFPR